AVLFDIDQGQPIASLDLGSNSNYNIDFLDSERVALHNYRVNGVDIYDLSLTEQLGRIEGSGEGGFGIHLDRTNGYIVSFDAEGVHLWDLPTGRKENFWDDPLNGL